MHYQAILSSETLVISSAFCHAYILLEIPDYPVILD